MLVEINKILERRFKIGLMDKEDVAHIYNEILLSHKKKRNGVIYSEVDGTRDFYTE